jgi:tetratricopeptide (TPR) repeat protein
VLWINGGSSARLNESYRNIAQALSIPGWIDPSADVQRLVMDWLSDSSREGWLLVIDNADEIEEIFPEKATQTSTKDSVATILRSCANLSQGSVIVTTRDSRLENRLATVESTLKVPLMSNSEALELLQTRISRAKYSHSDASDLVEQLERLPLAITQASAFIVENDITISQYLELFKFANSSVGEVLSRAFEDPRRDYRSENSVMRTLVLSFNQIREKSPRSAAILSTIAHLDRAGIPEALLHDDGESPLQFMEAVGVLKAFSLVLADEEGKTNLKVHRLVQLSIRIWLQTIGQDLFYAQLTMIMVSEKFPSAENDLDEAFHTWDLCKRLYPHVQTVEKTEPISKEAKLAKAKLQRKMGMYELIRGRPEDSIFRHRQAAIAFREVTDNDIGNKIVALQNMSNLGTALSIAGSFEESEKLYYQACTATEKLLGKDHPLTTMMLCNLADNQVFSRKFNQADKLYRRIYKMRVTLLGEQHLDTLETLSNWGPALEWLGRFEECENILRHAVNGMRSCLPPDHPKLCYATNRLSSVLQKLGKSEEAEAMARETLRVRLQIYGPGNVDVVWSMYVLSMALRDQGKYAEALQLSKQAVQIREDALGRLHLVTLIALFNLAFFYRGLCQYQEAARLYQECTTRMRENYGAWHPLLVVTSAEWIRMKHHAKFQENHEDCHAEPRAYWVAMASRQISVLAHCCGAYNPDHKPWTDVLLLLEAYFLVIVEPWRNKMPLTSGLIILSALILFIAYFWFIFFISEER